MAARQQKRLYKELGDIQGGAIEGVEVIVVNE